MALGLCCQWLEQRTKRSGEVILENIISDNSLQLGAYKDEKYSRERILETYRNNASQILRVIPLLNSSNIKSFRLSSGIFPLYEFAGELARNDDQVQSSLKLAGQQFKQSGIRVTCHPGQYTVLSSDSRSTVENAKKELEYHAWIFDQMGFDCTPYYAINIHGGKANRSEQLIEVINTLPENVKNRLTLENDERCYNVRTLLDISRKTSVPIVLDTHHYTFGDTDLSFFDAVSETIKTWNAIKPLQHLSNTTIGLENAPFNQKRAHSDYIHYIHPLQLKLIKDDIVDVDVEAKAKNLALLKLKRDFNVKV